MYAVIQIGSSQYRVSEGDQIDVDRMAAKEGKSLTIDQVLLFSKGTDIRIGQPFLKDVKVTAKVVGERLGKKVTSFKYRLRKNSATKRCHRPQISSLNITKITA